MDDRVPEHRDSLASSSHEASLEPKPTRSEDLGKQWQKFTSLKTEIERSVRRPKLQEPRAEDAMAEPYFVQKILVTWEQQITRSSVTIANLETIIDTQHPSKTTSQEPINLERKSYLDCSSDMHCTRVEFGKGDVLVADLEELDTIASNLLQKTQCKGSNISQRKWKIHFFSRRWTNQTFWRRSGTENTYLDTGTPNSRRKSKGFSWRIRRVSSTTSRLNSGCQWSDKWFFVHVRKLHIPPSRWTQSQTLLAERRVIPCSTETHWRLQNYENEFGCYASAASMIIGTSMDQEICLILGQVSLSLLY